MIQSTHTLTPKRPLSLRGTQKIKWLILGRMGAPSRLYPEEIITHQGRVEGCQSWKVSLDNIPDLWCGLCSQTHCSEKATQRRTLADIPPYSLAVVIYEHGPEDSLGLGCLIGWGPSLLSVGPAHPTPPVQGCRWLESLCPGRENVMVGTQSECVHEEGHCGVQKVYEQGKKDPVAAVFKALDLIRMCTAATRLNAIHTTKIRFILYLRCIRLQYLLMLLFSFMNFTSVTVLQHLQ